MTRETYYKIGVLILVLSVITWMFLSNSWGAEPKESRSRDNYESRRTDRDRDGFPRNLDCNDRNASIYPGAPEILDDGIDQDCNGVDQVTAGTGTGNGSGEANPHANLAWDGSPGPSVRSCARQRRCAGRWH